MGWLQDTAASVLLAYGQDESAPHPGLLAYGQDESAPHPGLHREHLQLPFAEDNWADKPERSLIDDEFRELARSTHVSTSRYLCLQSILVTPHCCFPS